MSNVLKICKLDIKCGRKQPIAPLQFLAILNMLADLQYMSHASSTL